ncbi:MULTISPECIES: transglycosylase SLT domain-containing protein [Nocardioides]|uniref:Transglycosylase SLT domain-containing protein n=1 Tax=Nocardioides vastitatis TaxID=2568655 RepID=A0ABW0ZLA7_9ACTN|nr:transglycosylase SLT domain-containing protein [Nocardioides sp.]
MGGLRGAVVAVAMIATACAAPTGPASPKGATSSPTTGPADTGPATSPTGPASGPATEPSAGISTDRAAATRGARAAIPAAVLLEQLRRRAERIAKSLPQAPPPMDVDPGTNRALGYRLLLEFGFPADQWAYLDALWRRESGWNHLAENPRSGAYGIPQSLPAAKMAVVGSDWRTNPETQIMWGLAYIAARYGSAQRAWAHSERVGWY